MLSPLQVIESLGSSTTSVFNAVDHFRRESIPLTKLQNEQAIADIIGSDDLPNYSNIKEASLFFLYVVQETIVSFRSGDIPDMNNIWANAQFRCKAFIAENPWSIKEYASDESINEDGVRLKKGAKKDMAEALYNELNDGTNERTVIINAFINDLEMTKAGATTYFHNLKKKFGFNAPANTTPTRKKSTVTSTKKVSTKKVSKGQIAQTIYQEMAGSSKSDIVERIAKEANTSKAGANTYYCAAKKGSK